MTADTIGAWRCDRVAAASSKLCYGELRTFKISHVVSDLSERTSSYACAISGSLRMSAAAGMVIFFCANISFPV